MHVHKQKITSLTNIEAWGNSTLTNIEAWGN